MPGGYWLMDYLSPLESRRSYKTGMRMMYVLGPMAGMMFLYINSSCTYYPCRVRSRGGTPGRGAGGGRGVAGAGRKDEGGGVIWDGC